MSVSTSGDMPDDDTDPPALSHDTVDVSAAEARALGFIYIDREGHPAVRCLPDVKLMHIPGVRDPMALTEAMVPGATLPLSRCAEDNWRAGSAIKSEMINFLQSRGWTGVSSKDYATLAQQCRTLIGMESTHRKRAEEADGTLDDGVATWQPLIRDRVGGGAIAYLLKCLFGRNWVPTQHQSERFPHPDSLKVVHPNSA